VCRVVGLIDFRKTRGLDSGDLEVLSKMRDAMYRGGPDGYGSFVDGCLGLGHRRLAIIDLSPSGAQPMESGKWAISFNGEIYNFLEIKKRLQAQGYSFRTNSDTEVIIKAFDSWGEGALQTFRGMFAFALWNKETRTLLLCRDRCGVKPLYWYLKDGLFLFASEIKAFHQHPSFDKSLDHSVLPHYLQKGYLRCGDSIYTHVKTLPPGSILQINESAGTSISRYWKAEDVFEKAATDKRSEGDIVEELENVLTESFRLRMVADVDVGVFLSGGIDSSLVTALIQKGRSQPLRTFTIGFEDRDFDESHVASEIARTLGTDHTAMLCTEDDFKGVIPLLADIYDEPFGDSSAIPTYLLSQLARANVKVALSGDGGDELFGGYIKYDYYRHLSKLLAIPLSVRKLLYTLTRGINPAFIEHMASTMKMGSLSQMDNKYLKFQLTLLSKDLDDLFDSTSSYVDGFYLEQLLGPWEARMDSVHPNYPGRSIGYLGLKDLRSYLPDDILTKVDRASMYVGLEAREPFLDPRVIEFAFALPDKMKVPGHGESKYLLRKILSKYVSPKLIKRPKQGFTVPIAKWLKGVLKSELIAMENDKEFYETFRLSQRVCSLAVSSFLASEHRFNPHFIWFIFSLYKWYNNWIRQR